PDRQPAGLRKRLFRYPRSPPRKIRMTDPVVLEEVEPSGDPDVIRRARGGRADRTDPLSVPSIPGQQSNLSQMVLHLGIIYFQVVARVRGRDGIADRAAKA